MEDLKKVDDARLSVTKYIEKADLLKQKEMFELDREEVGKRLAEIVTEIEKIDSKLGLFTVAIEKEK